MGSITGLYTKRKILSAEIQPECEITDPEAEGKRPD
jgi:hypothetical protein